MARRPTATAAEIERALEAAHTARRDWVRVPIKERSALMLRFLEAMRAMNPGLTRELALQMGRPIRHGGELNSFSERVAYMASIAEEALAPIVSEPKAGFNRYIR